MNTPTTTPGSQVVRQAAAMQSQPAGSSLASPPVQADGFTLFRNAAGRLIWTAADGTEAVAVVPVRAFPISAVEEGLSLVDADGHERVWMAALNAQPPGIQQLVRDALAEREFMPEIRRLHGVSSFATPSTWRVDTDRGAFDLVLKGEEDIRRLSAGTLLVADTHGVQFLIRDLFALDKHSRKLLDRFL